MKTKIKFEGNRDLRTISLMVNRLNAHIYVEVAAMEVENTWKRVFHPSTSIHN